MAVVKLVATLSSYGRRAVVVGGVADRYASELARVGQSNRQRAGTGSASPQRATRPPLWPAGMAEGNRETFGPRVGLSSHGSPAKGGSKSKCLARVKIARTSAGPPSLTISDPSRFPFPVPLSVPGPVPLSVPPFATAVFAVRGLIDWKLGLILSAVSFAGAAAGAALARNLSNHTLRRIFLVAVLALAAKTLLYDVRW